MVSSIITSPVGNIQLSLVDNCLLGLTFTDQKATPAAELNLAEKRVSTQLAQYFTDGMYSFDLPLKLVGTEFQQRVWKALQHIPAGTTVTYGDLASDLNTSARAVGNACRANPIPIVVPCHRVIGQKGLTGYAGETSGSGMKTKSFLLEHERAIYR